MSKQKLRVLCYDVQSNKRRRRISKYLEEVGTRVQYSVFEARLTDSQLLRVTSDLEKILDQKDSLRVYTLGKSGENHSHIFGLTIPMDKGAGYWVI